MGADFDGVDRGGVDSRDGPDERGLAAGTRAQVKPTALILLDGDLGDGAGDCLLYTSDAADDSWFV